MEAEVTYTPKHMLTRFGDREVQRRSSEDEWQFLPSGKEHVPDPDIIERSVQTRVNMQARAKNKVHEARVRAAIMRYLEDIHSSNWGRSFSIDRPDSRETAVDFIMDLFTEIGKHIDR